MGGRFFMIMGPKLAIFPRFEPKMVAKLAIFRLDFGDSDQKSSANTGHLVA